MTSISTQGGTDLAEAPGGSDAPERPRRLGDVLVAAGLLSPEKLTWALEVQVRTGSRLGSILVAAGLVPRFELYKVLADLWDTPFVDCTRFTPDPELLGDVAPSRLAKELWAPLLRRSDGSILVATANEPTPERRRAIARALGSRVELAVTSDWDIGHLLRRVYKDDLLDQASLGLWRRDEQRSARTVFTARQGAVLVALLVALVAGLLLERTRTVAALSAVIAVAFSCSVGFKFLVCLIGAHRENIVSVTDEEAAALEDSELPMYSVLVPVFHEASVVPKLMANLSALDYPEEKLEILLLLEEGDDETRQTAAAAHPPETVTFVTIPKGAPQTKPKACNVGLFFARGEFLVIYDAEDLPDADQLRKAVAAFQKGGEDLVCVQAALNYFNAEENALTRMFTLEYSFWFDYMLPGLEALRLPIPLGGTSNHFRTDELRRLGGWDPFNVTEDADLGIRAAALGRRVGVIPSTTLEEANNAYGNFVRQRSRWIKGYMQTTLVHLRHPVELVRAVGFRQAFGFSLLIGGTPLSFLAVPPLYLLLAISLVLPPGRLAPYFPGWVLWVSLLNLALGTSLMIYVSMMGVFKRRRYRLVLWAVLSPVYWMLHAAASYKALWQLLIRPHYWEKTVHGLSTVQPAAHPEAALGAQALAR